MALIISPGDPSFGTLIQVLSSAPGAQPETFATIEGVNDIDGPTMEMEEIETTSHSTGVPFRTFIPGLKDPGTVSFPCYFNPSDPTHSLTSPYGLERLFYDGTVTKWRLINTDVGRRTREFYGFPQALSESYPISGVNTRNVTIRVSGTMEDVITVVTLTPTQALTHTAAGESAIIAVTSPSAGSWTASKDRSWITIDSPAPGIPQVGNGSVNYTVAANITGTSRDGVITIGDKNFNITQAG